MRKRSFWGYSLFVLSAALITIGVGTGTALAVDSSSANYQITEMQIGNGSTFDSCSSGYCAQATIGDQGKTSSQTTAEFGEVKTDEPLLQMIIEPGVSNLGVLSTENTATKTTHVRIKNNFEGGYVLQMVGDPPKLGTHALTAMTSPTTSRPGTEQFGVNLVANTSPEFGEDPVQVPSSGTIFGEAAAAYATPNLFKYVSEDIIARSVVESGRTDYTISMIVNISNVTAAGHYSGDFALFVIPTI